MCYQLTEFYSACRCIYYIHAIDRCASFDRPGHGVQKRSILVGYACSSHSSSYASFNSAKENDGADESQISDDDEVASVFSQASAPSTNITFPDDTKQEASDMLFQELLNEFSLRHLWPQIVRISQSQDVAIKTIARYLSRFSRDLRTNATSRLHKDAARFVGLSRQTVADRIVECHISELICTDELTSVVTTKDMSLDGVIEETEEIEDPDSDGKNVIYENVQQFIFEGASFQSFVSSLRLFASTDTESSSELGYNARQYFNYIRCGQMGYDDYHERRSGAIEELQALLKDYEEMNLELVDSTGPTSVRPSTGNLSSIMKCLFPVSFFKKTSGKLPTFNQRQKLGEACHTSSSTQTSAVDPKHRFLIVCAPFQRQVSKAHQPDICKIHSDRDFFQALRYTYSGSRRALRWRWLRRVSSIDFVKFEIFSSEIVNIQQCPSLPGNQERMEYDFEQCDTSPPIGPNLLSHLFENPDHAEVLPVLFNRIPKKLGKKLCACPRKGSSVGWGIRFVEGLDPFAVFICGCVGFVVSLAVSLIYTLVMDDIQGGFAIGAHMLAFFLFCGGCLQSALG
ncbi:unnamed protein product [Fusarium venenatum]|uniref:Uncharacterized protein n=1 Tax=Fusarium venenatum TaxID=56646 RepID=A0A2L2T634_9HYPO|nr:uncharacterized protein FVRRES_02764 [Fusarium venenatum]CEI66252.1 unnamed protein product [Fusarium venenatum]